MRSQVAALQLVAKDQSRPQTPPSHEEKRSGEPSRISWASGRFTSKGRVCRQIFETSIGSVAGEIMAVTMFIQLVDLFYSEQFCFYR